MGMLVMFLYSDGVGTVFHLSTVYASAIGVSNANVLGSTILNRVTAAAFSLIWGIVVNHFRVMRLYMFIISLAAVAAVMLVLMSKAWHYWCLSVLLALIGSGGFCLSRSIMSNLVP